MFQSLKKLFNRPQQQDPLAAQRERLLAISKAETLESTIHTHMHKADLNALISAVDPTHPGNYGGPAKRAKNAPVLSSWLRAEPNTYPERTPMLYRIFLVTADEKARAGYEHTVMVSNNALNKNEVAALFTAWNNEAARIAQLPPEPEEKKPENPKAEGEVPPAPPAP